MRMPEVLVEVAGAVVPPGVLHGLRVDAAVGVDEAAVEQAAEARPLVLGHVRGEERRVVDVEVGRRDVEVAADGERGGEAAHVGDGARP